MEKLIAVIITLITAGAFFLGWVYLYSYYDYFGIDVLEINPSIQIVLVYATPVLFNLFSSSDGLLFGLIALLLLAIFGILFFFVRQWSWVALIALFVIFGFGGYRAAITQGKILATQKWMNDSDPALLEFSPDAVPKEVEIYNREKQLRFILSTPQFHYLFAREQCDLDSYTTCNGFVFRIKVADVQAIRILHTGEAKGPREAKQ
jgi:hypothetical protein